MSEADGHILFSGSLSATVKAAGAELCSLRDGAAREYLWQAGPEWPRHSPMLFPIVGRLKDDQLAVDGETYRMMQHGFARDRTFAWAQRDQNACRLVLTDDETTRAIYPFSFRLEIGYALDERGLWVRYALTNPGNTVLPASLGVHPAFNWPLPESTTAKADHRLLFETAEPEPIRRLDRGLLRSTDEPTPIAGRVLALNETLFADDALILLAPRSRWVRFEAPDGPAISVSWDGFSELGLWSQPAGAGFLCIEPWRGYASPVTFDGPFQQKPGLMLIGPGATRELGWRVEIIEGFLQ